MKYKKVDLLDALNAKKLWENPDPTIAFPAQTIELPTLDFDLYEIFYRYTNANNQIRSSRSFKNCGSFLSFIDSANNSAIWTINWVSPDKLQIGNANYFTHDIQNTALIPVAVYGHKL